MIGMETITLNNSRQPLGDILSTPLINCYSALSIAPYWQGVNFLTNNLASFGRSVHEDGAKLVEKHPLDRFLKRRPNQYQPSFTHWRTWYFHAIHKGNGYSFIKRAADSTVAGIYNLDPDDVTPYRVLDDTGDFTAGSLWYWHEPSKRPIAAADILHLPALSYDGLVGYSPIHVLAQTFGTAALVEARTARSMRKGTNIIGSVEIPAGVTEERQDQIVATLKKFRDPNSERDVMVLSDGAKLNNAALSPQQLQLVEQGALSTKRIAQVLGLDPTYLFERSESKYANNTEQAGQDVVRFTFRPWIECAEDELTAKLLSEPEQDAGRTVEIDPNDLLRGDTATQMTVATQGVAAGVLKKNEGREIIGLAADDNPESDQLLTPHNVASAPTPQGGTK